MIKIFTVAKVEFGVTDEDEIISAVAFPVDLDGRSQRLSQFEIIVVEAKGIDIDHMIHGQVREECPCAFAFILIVVELGLSDVPMVNFWFIRVNRQYIRGKFPDCL